MAMIVFEEEEGPMLALSNNKTRVKNLLGEKMQFKKPISPTDIIWEHREQKDFVKRHILAFITLAVLLLSSSVVVYEISSYEQSIADMFP